MKAIFATGKKGEMGKDNQLLFYIKEDLQRFKTLTMGAPIIMGRNTFESLPAVLPGRLHIVLTQNKNYKVDNHNVIVCYDKEEVDLVLMDYDKEPFVIGGPAILQMFEPVIHTYHITYVDKEFPHADVRTTLYERSVLRDFERVASVERKTEEIDGTPIPYSFIDFERKTI